jgi:hypothetical protein
MTETKKGDKMGAVITTKPSSNGSNGVSVKSASVTSQPSGGFSLPTKKSEPRDNLGDYTWLIYGEKKIGKTSLASQFPDALFMMFEPGGKGLSIYQVELANWKAFKEYIKLLKKSPDQFKTIIIDTVDIAYERAFEHVGNREGFTHPSEVNDFGASWKLIRQEFESTILELVNTGRGVMFLSHATESEFQEASGNKYNKLIPTMSKQARAFVIGFVDIIAYYGYYGKERLLTIQGSDAVDAGHRLDGKFLVSGGEEQGNRVHSIPMGNSSKEGYDNIQKAFRNEQDSAYRPDAVTGMSEIQVKRPNRK